MKDQMLEKLCKDYFNYFIQEFPPMASMMGIHDYDEELPEGTPESIDRFFSKRRQFYESIKAIDPSELSFDYQMDRDALLITLEVTMFEDEAQPKHNSLPLIGEVIGGALYSVFVKEYIPFAERIRRLASRISKIPKYIENSKRLYTNPVSLWVKMSQEDCDNLIGFIKIIQKSASLEGVNDKLLRLLQEASDKAIESIKGYERWLMKELLPKAKENFAMKPEDFEKFISLRRLGMDTQDLIDFGERMLQVARERQKALAKQIAPDKTLEEVADMMAKNHPPTFEEALKLTQEAVNKSRQFVIDSGFATLPEGEKLIVVETPSFARHLIPFGAYMPPGRFDKDQTGYYWMSRPLKEYNQTLEIHNLGAILNTSVHEGYPGHHLQFVCANTNKSYARLMTNGTEFVEGWAHYCEEKVAQMGFSTEPEVMFERYNDMVWRAARIVVDIRLSRGDISFDEAVEYLHSQTGFDKASCITEIKRYTFTPGYQLSYLVGKKLIMDLLDEVEKRAEKFDLQKFHNTMLYAGNLPFATMRKIVFNAFNIQLEKEEVKA